MPEPLERSAFLRQVADSVDLQPHDVGEVLEELNSHLSDAAAGWREAGYDPDDAERRAIRGLGDPRALGHELGEARHERRHLLAAVGGGLVNAVGFGLWAWLLLWVVVGGLALVTVVATSSVTSAIGWREGSWLSGPAGSVGTVAITTVWFAWLGWALPWRVARSAHRSVMGVQRAVGLVGFVVGMWALWDGLQLTIDPVLAIGLPLGPFAYLYASQRPSHGPDLFPDTSLRRRFGLALGFVVATAILALATVTPSTGDQSWETDLSSLGGSADGQFLAAFQGFGGYSGGTDAGFSLALADDATAVQTARRYPTLAAEVWPVTVRDGKLLFGPAPIATTTRAMPTTADEVALDLTVPSYREPIKVSFVLVAVATDGSRVLLIGPDGPTDTAPWRGTILDWWFGPR